MGAYKNDRKEKKGESTHGEKLLLEQLENFLKDYKKTLSGSNNEVPLLILDTTYIPCHRDESFHTTFCAKLLRDRINKENGKIQLFIAFISVYSKTVGKGQAS